ncbi:helix-turn-helix domain-containing protein [Thermobrachium celere]|uniref:Predicted transcriptional regulator n=1 Tax=Thermobrachium celere DSM 8682 TaxID=941824 RepID=R7RSR2_9CLOT|nr:S24 family peptidase [Thermobrachium celere]GFR35140.1 transcriptional regulator [Thermobrachium celere]CDF59059.1 predicted transcriptional regulator [Thermobrachium celere DSM 8682]
MSRVGLRIKQERIKANFSTKELAKKLGISEGFLQDVELGRRIASEDLIKRIEKVLNINLNDSLFDEVEQPIENIKEYKEPVKVNKQMEEAFSSILKKIPVCDLYLKEIYDYKYLPIKDKKVEGYNAEKVFFIIAPDDSMRGFRIAKGDKIMVYLTQEMENNAIYLVDVDGKRMIRQLKRLDANRVLLISQNNDIKTESRDIKTFKIIGRCIRVEFEL